MNDRQEAKYAMYLAVENFTLGHQAVWSSRQIFADLFATFQEKLDALKAGISEQEQNTAGITRRKKELKEVISRDIMPVIDALQLHAALTDDAELLGDSDFTRSDFAHGRYGQTATNAENVLDLAEAKLGESMADYGLAAEDLTALRDTVTEFRGLFGRTRAKISEGAVATAEILRLMEDRRAPRVQARQGRRRVFPPQRAAIPRRLPVRAGDCGVGRGVGRGRRARRKFDRRAVPGIRSRPLKPRCMPVRSVPFPSRIVAPLAYSRYDACLKDHPSYTEAKAGDAEAAVELVSDVALPFLTGISGKLPADAIYTAPHAREATGDNAIPQVFATACALISGGALDTDLVQISRVFHTGADPMERMASRPDFEGIVHPDANYILVDDVTTMGGTLAELASYIQERGGNVADVVVLVNAGRAEELHPSRSVLAKLKSRHESEIERIFGIQADALTANEANYLIGVRTADEIRNRLAKAREETDRRLRSKGFGA
jgi:hypothetical protein